MRISCFLALSMITCLGVAVPRASAQSNPLRTVSRAARASAAAAESNAQEELPRPTRESKSDDPPPTSVDNDDPYYWDYESGDDSEWMQYTNPPPMITTGLNGLFVRGEYLRWATSGLDLPPLVTTSPTGTARAAAGVLGPPATTVLFGDSSINDDIRSGARITFGTWMGDQRGIGLEGDYFALDDESTQFTRTSLGNPILARPFFNMLTGLETAELVAFPNLISGTVNVDAMTRLQGAGARFVFPLCAGGGCVDSLLGQGARGDVYYAFRCNMIAGYRFARLDDRLTIGEDLTSRDPQNPGTFQMVDQFQTENQFHGADLGMMLQSRRGPWTLEGLVKVGIGNNRGTVQIAGSTNITQGGITDQHSGGLLAQRTNIGTYTQDQFAMLPELGLNLGLNLNPNWRITCGYTFLYWSRVLRAGDQIDLDLNPNLLPPEANPFTGPLRPRFEYHYTDLWAQGMNVGLEGRW